MYNREAINILLWKAEMPCLNVWEVSQASQLCDWCHTSPELCTTIINQVIFIILATFKKKKCSKPLRVRDKGREGKGQGSHFSTLEKTLTLGQG